MGSKRNHKETLIISSGQPGKRDYDDNLELKLYLADNGYSYKEVLGSIDGYMENSFVVVPRTEERRKQIIGEVLMNYNQSEVILLNYKRDAYSITLTGRDYLGKLRCVDKSEAEGNNYTYCPKNFLYYTIVKY